MPRFSSKSAAKLATCDPRLRKIFEAVVRFFDCSILVGHRNEEDQNDAFDRGASKVRYPDSKHNRSPSLAADVDVYPSDLGDLQGDPPRELRQSIEGLAELDLDTEAAALVENALARLDALDRYSLARERLSYFAGAVIATGEAQGTRVRWGGDWRNEPDRRIALNNFDDLFHFEIAS